MTASWSRLVFMAALLLVAACRPMIRQDARIIFSDAPPAVEALISAINRQNDAVSPFKGIGQISIRDSSAVQTSRAAWAGSPDGRLRIEFLGLPGQPAAKLIFDGRLLYVESVTEPESYRKSVADPDLKPITGVSIKAGEVITCLAGGIPIYEHDAVFLEPASEENRQALVFNQSWRGVVEKIFFNGLVIEKVEIWEWGTLVYQAALKDIREVNGRLIPFHLVITDADNRGFEFRIDRCWTDIGVSPEIFKIPLGD